MYSLAYLDAGGSEAIQCGNMVDPRWAAGDEEAISRPDGVGSCRERMVQALAKLRQEKLKRKLYERP